MNEQRTVPMISLYMQASVTFRNAVMFMVYLWTVGDILYVCVLVHFAQFIKPNSDGSSKSQKLDRNFKFKACTLQQAYFISKAVSKE